MKNLFLIQAALLLGTSGLMAQVPQSFNYQAVARDNGGVALANQAVSLRISITEGASGPADYVETHTKTTSAAGLFTLSIGGGSVVSGTFANVNWSTANKFLKVEMDPAGTSNYQLIGSTQLLSVPYALNAGNGLSNGTATNQLMYWTGSAWAVLEPGTDNQVLTICNGALTWSSGGVCQAAAAEICGDGIDNDFDGLVDEDCGGGVEICDDGIDNDFDGHIDGEDPDCSGNGVYPVGTVHCSTPTAVVDVTNPITGKTWMDRNLGASRAATSSTDEEAYGDLYQWGRGADGHQCRNSGTTTTLSSSDVSGNGNFIITTISSSFDWRSPQNVNLWQGVNGVNNPCPSGYRLPTHTEFEEEHYSWSPSSSVGAFASPLKLPMAGYRDFDGSVHGVTSHGYYWSSTVINNTISYYLYFQGASAFVNSSYRAPGYSVRCLKD